MMRIFHDERDITYKNHQLTLKFELVQGLHSNMQCKFDQNMSRNFVSALIRLGWCVFGDQRDASDLSLLNFQIFLFFTAVTYSKNLIKIY